MIGKLQRRLRAFTLVELMVALSMGLIVGTTVVALSKEVTNTFHEEARVITAESGLRTAMDRLRSDISRASMMSTGNAAAEPGINLVSTAPDLYLSKMAGIRIMPGGSTSTNGYLKTPVFDSNEDLVPILNGLTPDSIEITGNLSPNGDYYSVQSYTSTGKLCSGGGPQILISNIDSAYRVGSIDGSAGIDANAAFSAAFVPVTGKSFYARIQDRNTSSIPLPQDYVVVTSAGYDSSSTQLYVCLAPTSQPALGGFGEGSIINPISTVRWRIAKSPTPSSGPYSNVSMNPTGDKTKFDLVRTYLDSTGNEVGAGDNPLGEVVAEYMVDMKFGGTVDTTTEGNPDAGPNLSVLSFDDGGIATWAGPITDLSPATKVPPHTTSGAPQRMRSISIRLSSRTATPDRTVNIYPDPANTTQPYMFRYAIGDAGQYARVRTLMSEVFLLNQANATYP